MEKTKRVLMYGIGVLLAAFVLIFMQGVSNAVEPDAWRSMTMLGTVVNKNVDAREITLSDSLNNRVTFGVDTRVKRFDQVAVGDKVVADYYVSLSTDIRRATKEEKKIPFVELDKSDELPPNCTLKAGGIKMYRAVVTVIGTDRFLQMIQVKGPKGGVYTVRAPNPNVLGKDKITVGDTAIVTYTEPIITSLKKR